MKTDRELLELAARAAGLQIGHWVSFFGGEFAVTQIHSEINSWNPIECDADALRLAVNLNLCVSPNAQNCAVSWPPHSQWVNEIYKDGVSHAESARRAIVRAAAAIGEGME